MVNLCGCNNLYRRVGEGHVDFRKLSFWRFSEIYQISIQQQYGAEIQAVLHPVFVSFSADWETENNRKEPISIFIVHVLRSSDSYS